MGDTRRQSAARSHTYRVNRQAGATGRRESARRLTVDYQEGAREAVRAFFGRDLTDAQVGGIALARPGDTVRVHGTRAGGGLRLELHGADGTRTTVFAQTRGGPMRLFNWLTSAPGVVPHAPIDVGLLRKQMDTARGLGVRHIDVKAHGQGGDWRALARMGYDAHIADEPHEWKSPLPAALAGARTVHDLMATPAGRAYFDANFTTGRLVLDLTPGSRGPRMFADYAAGRTPL